VLRVLEHRAYLDGTRYYETAECFLFFTSRLLRNTDDPSLHLTFVPILRERILERAGAPGDALALAMRVLAGVVVGLRMERDLAALLPLQCEDGGWGPSWIYKYGSSGIKIGNRGLTTALALNAIAALDESHPQPRLQSWSPRGRPLPQPQSQSQSQPQPRLRLRSNNIVAPLPRDVVSLSGTSSVHLPSPPPSPTSPSLKQSRKEGVFSAGVIAKGVYAYLFMDSSASKHAHTSRITRNPSVGRSTPALSTVRRVNITDSCRAAQGLYGPFSSPLGMKEGDYGTWLKSLGTAIAIHFLPHPK
jgi:hypothetical protein